MAEVGTQLLGAYTCSCVLRATVDDGGSGWANPTLTATEIVTTCDVHAAITDPPTLMTTMLAEMAPLVAAYNVLNRYWELAEIVIADWYLKTDRTSYARIRVTDGDPPDEATIVAALDAIPNLEVEYV